MRRWRSSRRARLAVLSTGFVGLLAFLGLLVAIPGTVRIEPAAGPHAEAGGGVTWSDAPAQPPANPGPGGGAGAGAGGAIDVEWDTPSITRLDAEDRVEFDCMIEPWESVSIRSPVIGRLDAIHVERADVVRKGDLLIELDAALSFAELQVAEQRADMKASIRASKARRRLGRQRAERARELYSQNAMAANERDEIQTETEVSEWAVEESLEEYQLAQRQLDRERARFERRRIRSPIDGIVSDRLMAVGEVVDEETVLELAQIDPLRVEVILPAVEFGTIRPGMSAAVVPEIPGDDVVVATVRVVDQIIDSASGTFGAELELPNPGHAIPGGMRCRIDFFEARAAVNAGAGAADPGGTQTSAP